MKFSVITPAFNALRWLPACVASVRHVCKGMEYEHWVIDGSSTDGTRDFLQSQPDVRWISEPDQGMYDALNKGLARASGEIVGHLNADEQYNRVGLRAALAVLEGRPAVDAVFGPTVMVDAEQSFLQLFKQIVVPRTADVEWCMPVQSCSLLTRRAIALRCPYDTRFRLVADHAWFYQQMKFGLRLAPVSEPMGIFTWRADNLSNVGASEDALDGLPRNTWRLKLAKHHYRWRKFLAGGYRRDPVDYEIVQGGNLRQVHVAKPALKLPPERLRERP
jgi:glycosyltransferase